MEKLLIGLVRNAFNNELWLLNRLLVCCIVIGFMRGCSTHVIKGCEKEWFRNSHGAQRPQLREIHITFLKPWSHDIV